LSPEIATGWIVFVYKTAPGQGVWLNGDPLREGGWINIYGFVANDPINAIDPWGLSLYDYDPTENLDGSLTLAGGHERQRPGALSSGSETIDESLETARKLAIGAAANFTPVGRVAKILGAITRAGKSAVGRGVNAVTSMFKRAPKQAAKTTPVWPKTAPEMNSFLKVEGKAIPDALTTPGRNKTVWELGPSKITLEQHPYHPNAPTWHKDLHWHLDTPSNPHQRWLPGDPIPGY